MDPPVEQYSWEHFPFFNVLLDQMNWTKFGAKFTIDKRRIKPFT